MIAINGDIFKAQFEYYTHLNGSISRLLNITDSYKKCREVIKPGAFGESIRHIGVVPVLLNHTSIIANTRDVAMYEDSIGLMVAFKTDDLNVIRKIIDNKICGCSFGFIAEEQSYTDKGEYIERLVTQLQLTEVTLTDRPGQAVYEDYKFLGMYLPENIKRALNIGR